LELAGRTLGELASRLKVSDLKTKRFPWKTLLQIAAVLMVAAALVIALPKIDFAALKQSLMTLDPLHSTLALMGVSMLWVGRCLLLGRLMNLRVPFPFAKALSVGLMGGFMDQVIPARGGMVFRWALIHKTTKASKSFVFSALMTAFVLEGIGLLILFLGVVAFDESASQFSSPGLIVVFILSIVVLLLLIPFSNLILRRIRGTFIEKLRPLVSLLEIASIARNPWKFCEWTLIVAMMWIGNIWAAYELASAFSMTLSISQLILMLFVINVAILIPAVPGNLGTMQLAITWVLVRFGILSSTAVAYSLVFHAIHVVPILILGAIVLVRHTAKGAKAVPSQIGP